MTAIAIEHDFDDATPVTVVIDCSPPGETESAAFDLAREAAELVKSGDLEGAQAKITAAQTAIAESATQRVTVRPLTDDELVQREADAAAATAYAQHAADADAAKQALATKLRTGKATPAEVQAVLADLIAP